MSRASSYLIHVSRPDPDNPGERLSVTPDGLRYVWEWVPAGNSALATPRTSFDYPDDCGATDQMPGKRGWDGIVIGAPRAATRTVTLDLRAIMRSASTEVRASVAYLVSPSYGTRTLTLPGGYTRSVGIVNTWRLWSDRGEPGGAMTTLEYIGVQRPQPSHSVSATKRGPVELKIELVDLVRFALEQTKSADVAAYVPATYTAYTTTNLYTDGYAFSNTGPYYIAQVGGIRQYTNVTFTDYRYRLYTLHTMTAIFDGVATVAGMVAALIAREPVTLDFASAASLSDGTSATTRDHWTLSKMAAAPRPAWSAGSDLPRGNRLICTQVQEWVHTEGVGDAPDGPVFHGFLMPGEIDTKDGSYDDTLASWGNCWDWLADESASAGCKLMPTWFDLAGLRLRVWFRAIKEKGSTGAITLSPTECAEPIDLQVGEETVPRATFTHPKANGTDSPSMEAVPSLTSEWGARNDAGYSLPRGFHTSPTCWPDGVRQYDILTSGPSQQLRLKTHDLNCLTIWYWSDWTAELDGNPDGQPTRAHHSVTVSDGVSTYSDSGISATLPIPDPADWEDSDETMDTEFGTPLQACYLTAQQQTGTPYTAAHMIATVYGSPLATTTSVELDAGRLGQEELGGVVSATTWANGNAVLNGETYLGALPGSPIVAEIEDDITGTHRAKVRLLAP